MTSEMFVAKIAKILMMLNKRQMPETIGSRRCLRGIALAPLQGVILSLKFSLSTIHGHLARFCPNAPSSSCST